jgi:hypothetical protein
MSNTLCNPWVANVGIKVVDRPLRILDGWLQASLDISRKLLTPLRSGVKKCGR